MFALLLMYWLTLVRSSGDRGAAEAGNKEAGPSDGAGSGEARVQLGMPRRSRQVTFSCNKCGAQALPSSKSAHMCRRCSLYHLCGTCLLLNLKCGVYVDCVQ